MHSATDRPPGDSFLPLDAAAIGLPEPLANDVELVNHALAELLLDQGQADLLRLARELYAEGDALPPEGVFQRFPALQDPAIVFLLLRAFAMLFPAVNAAEQKE